MKLYKNHTIVKQIDPNQENSELIINRKEIQKYLNMIPLNERELHLTSEQLEYIKSLLIKNNASIVAHYYTESSIQKLAELTGGFVGDSLEMALWGQSSDARTLIVAGVKFMGETAKIISPEKTILMPSLNATCSLDISCPVDEFKKWKDNHKDRTTVVYANTSAEVKAISDWVVTSSIAVPLIQYLDNQGKKLLWAPDKYLGEYVKKKTNANILLWDGACVVHEEFRLKNILDLKKKYPKAAVLVHPESPSEVIDIADSVGSTSQLIKASKELPNKTFIVATEKNIFYKMQQEIPNKKLIEASSSGSGATCISCSKCPWMSINNIETIEKLLEDNSFAKLNEIHIDPEVINLAKIPINRMIDFKKKL